MRLQRARTPPTVNMTSQEAGGGGGDRLDFNANDTQEPLLDKGSYSSDLTPGDESQTRPRSVTSRVQFNIGGVIFQTLEATVKRSKSKKFKLSDPTFLFRYYDHGRGEYFFDRDPEVFRSVLNYWRTGHLHVPASMCGPQVTCTKNSVSLTPNMKKL
ncbi:potassium voltage-gated channel protein Shaw [Elysia marginata]|uniref:Potassium voltage-gated channel protein Shaw n=1 Tax=Elysia marginata TaxID=1093978 RepID=A0AAV4GYM6_9GAST|nr:potassium voltage-gated channel protein Shaw [Elysia marginata]